MLSSSNAISDLVLSVAKIECCDTWHGRLAHVNKNTIKKMMHLDLIPKSPINLNDRCQVCVEVNSQENLSNLWRKILFC